MDTTTINAFFSTYQPVIIGFIVMALLAFLMIRLTLSFRVSAEEELERLRFKNPELFLERLQNNRRLNWVFRKNELLIMQMDGQMRLGEDAEVLRLIETLDSHRLEPREKVEYLQKRMSFFASTGNSKEAKASYERLDGYLHAVKADQVEKYRSILDEGQEIIQVYVDKNPRYRSTLQAKMATTQNPIQKGIRLYRLAKLSWFARDEEAARTFLSQAKPLLQGSDYAPILDQAEEDLSILAIK